MTEFVSRVRHVNVSNQPGIIATDWLIRYPTRETFKAAWRIQRARMKRWFRDEFFGEVEYTSMVNRLDLKQAMHFAAHCWCEKKWASDETQQMRNRIYNRTTIRRPPRRQRTIKFAGKLP